MNPEESLSPYIDSFLTMIAVEKGLAKNTVEAYSRDLARLVGFPDRTECCILGGGGAHRIFVPIYRRSAPRD